MCEQDHFMTTPNERAKNRAHDHHSHKKKNGNRKQYYTLHYYKDNNNWFTTYNQVKIGQWTLKFTRAILER